MVAVTSSTDPGSPLAFHFTWKLRLPDENAKNFLPEKAWTVIQSSSIFRTTFNHCSFGWQLHIGATK